MRPIDADALWFAYKKTKESKGQPIDTDILDLILESRTILRDELPEDNCGD